MSCEMGMGISLETSSSLVAFGDSAEPPEAPTASGALVDQTYPENSGAQTYDVSGVFFGVSMVFSLVSPPTGVTINSATGVVSCDTDVLAIQSGTEITVRAANAGGSVTRAFGLTVEAAAGPVTIMSVDVTPNAGGVFIDIFATGVQMGDIGNWVLVPASGGPSVAAGTFPWPNATVSLQPGIPLGSYVLSLTFGNSQPVTSPPFITSTVPPQLTNILATAADMSFIWSVTSDVTGGTLYAALRPSGDPAGTVQDVITGTGYNAAQSLTTPSADDVNTGNFADLEAGSYIVDIVHVDMFGNTSAVISSPVVTLSPIASTSPTATFLSTLPSANNNFPSTSRTLDLSQANTGDDIWIAAHGILNGISATPTLTIEGVAATLIGSTPGAISTHFYRIACPAAAAGDASASVIWDAGAFIGKFHVGCWKVENASSYVAYQDFQSNASGPIDVSGDVGAGVVLVGAVLRNGEITGSIDVAEDHNAYDGGARSYGYFSATTAPQTPRTMQILHTATSDPIAGMCIALS